MSNTIPLRIALTPDRPKDLPLPSYAHPGDAGLDLVAMESATVHIGSRTMVRTGVRVEIPEGYFGLVTPRSGLASKRGVACVLGTIDGPFRGELKVNIQNHGHDPVEIAIGDRIAQLVILPVARAVLEVVDDLSPSSRGEAGFGSSGR